VNGDLTLPSKWGCDRLVTWKGEKVLHVHDERGLGKSKIKASYSHKRLRVTNGCVWFVKMGGGTNGKCMVYIGDGMEIRFMVAHDKTNG
jgi:hypothetical protein